ncbi:helix-turn-helix domain-containing protein [Amycolatopsis sp. PS_44_ISF1]|uniref:TetR/AcrR family transcriptional regulator n=1 Tax=Amycolatopsis sp. PS_44_ISF1 TaxID=2974917 RepID=UPI0028E005F0|nr:helix-turn-helix domain-containing protein [Amycolatopsis sp. PS_44_ISF1]MDT8912897.1 TetR/AcrR family transcriptional regulator [Amycolatopsis sp. PS_44_ISF1]
MRQAQHTRTHRNLLDATVRCLVEFGYAGTTTQRVQERAGVSRGALLHHFGSKQELFVAAIHHVAEAQLARLREEGPARSLPDLVAAVRAAMSGPLYLAGLELWMGARTDPALHASLVPAEREVGRELRTAFARARSGRRVSEEDSRLAVDSLLMLLRGLALTSVLRADEAAADALVEQWVAAHG